MGRFFNRSLVVCTELGAECYSEDFEVVELEHRLRISVSQTLACIRLKTTGGLVGNKGIYRGI